MTWVSKAGRTRNSPASVKPLQVTSAWLGGGICRRSEATRSPEGAERDAERNISWAQAGHSPSLFELRRDKAHAGEVFAQVAALEVGLDGFKRSGAVKADKRKVRDKTA